MDVGKTATARRTRPCVGRLRLLMFRKYFTDAGATLATQCSRRRRHRRHHGRGRRRTVRARRRRRGADHVRLQHPRVPARQPLDARVGRHRDGHASGDARAKDAVRDREVPEREGLEVRRPAHRPVPTGSRAGS